MTLVLLDDDTAQVVRRVPQGEARREATLRDLIADQPDILPIHDLDPSYGQLVTVTKELSIPGVGFVDILLVDQHGRLVVVECKLWRNPQARREVVGQILDYARELSRYGYEDLQRQVSIATKRQGNILYALASDAGSTLAEADFVDRVSRDLAAGRFLLLVVGDGITEGTRRIGEYLRDQPGLAFTFGLIEMAEYRYVDAGGSTQQIVQPRVLAQTAVIERHVIRSDVPGIVVEPAITRAAPYSAEVPATAQRVATDAGARWRRFAEQLLAEMRFDDPGQPSTRPGGLGWLRVPLPGGLYVNVNRAVSSGGVLGAQVRFPGSEGRALFDMLEADRSVIDAEVRDGGLGDLAWEDGEVPLLSIAASAPLPWDEPGEAEQRAWMARAANQFVNSLRPRLQRLGQDLAA